jgi:hypothetical protein
MVNVLTMGFEGDILSFSPDSGAFFVFSLWGVLFFVFYLLYRKHERVGSGKNKDLAVASNGSVENICISHDMI